MRRILKALLAVWIGKMVWNRVQAHEEGAEEPTKPAKKRPRGKPAPRTA